MLAAVAAAVISASTIQSALDAVWWRQLDLSGWTYATAAENTAYFVRPAASRAGTTRYWERSEYRSQEAYGSLRVQSSIAMVEADCTEQKTRILQETVYADAGLQGESRIIDRSTDTWRFVLPASNGAAVLRAGCATTNQTR